MKGVKLQAVDTLFFRGSVPFYMDGSPQEEVSGLFPPFPSTVSGAVRAALARCNGWDGGPQKWPDEVSAVLGSGPDDLGQVAFQGPIVLRDGDPLFPMPRCFLGSLVQKDGKERWRPRAALRPGSCVHCDLGEAVRLPDLVGFEGDRDGLKPGDGWWLTLAGMRKALQGRLPDEGEVAHESQLWRQEPRIGLKRDAATRRAEAGMLYSARHVRPHADVALGVHIVGIPDGWQLPTGRLIPLGGEGRAAECQAWSGLDPAALEMPWERMAAERRVAVFALTPLELDPAICSGREPWDVFGGLRVVSACMDRPARVGGWDGLQNRPLPVRSLVPAGSVLFCEAEDGDRLRAVGEALDALPAVGGRQAWGYGAVALGIWNEMEAVA